MLSRDDFIFTIGYDGPAALVDKRAKRQYGGLQTQELAKKGLFRSAYSSALYSGSEEELQFVKEVYCTLTGADFSSPERLFGVFPVEIKRCIYI